MRFFVILDGAAKPSYELFSLVDVCVCFKEVVVRGRQTSTPLSILIVIFSVQLQQTEISERKLFIFHLGHEGVFARIIIKSAIGYT